MNSWQHWDTSIAESAHRRIMSESNRGTRRLIGRHVQTKFLWIQQKVKEGILHVITVLGKDKPADIDTKHLKGDDVRNRSTLRNGNGTTW